MDSHNVSQSSRMERLAIPQRLRKAYLTWFAALSLLVPGTVWGQNEEIQTPWQQNANGALTTDVGWNYSMGYHFTPQVDGEVLELGGFFNGAKIVRLFDTATGTLLAQTEVSATNSWGYKPIKPVPVLADTQYTVAVYLAGSGGSFRSGITTLPQVYGDIRIDGSTFASTASDPLARPTNTVTSTMYGQADITFVPGISAPCLGVGADLRVNGLEWRSDHGEWQIKFNDCPQGSTCEVPLSLENIGASTVSLVALSLDRDVFYDDYLILDHNCSQLLLPPGASCSITLRYEMPLMVARSNPGKLILEVGKNTPTGILTDVTSVDISPSPVDLSGPDSVRIAVCAEDDLPGSDLCQ